VLSVAFLLVEAVTADPVLLNEVAFDLTEEPADKGVIRFIDPEGPNHTQEGSIAVHAPDKPGIADDPPPARLPED
jgi:hypothetical protein